MPQNPRYSRFISMKMEGLFGANAMRAEIFTIHPMIHWNGTVCPCTYDYDDRFVLGNLHNNSFEDIWEGSAYRAFRDRFRLAIRRISFVTNAVMFFKGGSCIDETVLPALFLIEMYHKRTWVYFLTTTINPFALKKYLAS